MNTKLGKINRKSIGISDFTSVLQRYEKMPSELYIAGKLPEKRIPAVAIVGSRRPSAYGETVTRQLAKGLAERGVVVISGLALGVDGIAHKAALEAGGTTIAVLAGGLHRVYPASHQSLAEDIIKKGGALISEKPPGEDAHRYDFLARNRLVSGLADAIVVTEATERSGTYSTVVHALSQNKEVFAVPGPITSLLSAGTNRIIQDGAHVALSVDDILNVIAPQLIQKRAQLRLVFTPLEQHIVSLISAGTHDIELVIQQCDEPPNEVLQAITMMELNGVVRAQSGRLFLEG